MNKLKIQAVASGVTFIGPEPVSKSSKEIDINSFGANFSKISVNEFGEIVRSK